MSIENITLFSELHAEPSWLQDLRKQAFDKIDQLELPAIERVKFHRWNLGDGTITESEASANVSRFYSPRFKLKIGPKLELKLYLNRCHKPWQTKESFSQISILP